MLASSRQRKVMRIAVVVPVLEEAATLPRTLPAVLAALAPGDELVVADGGSADGTAAVARRLGARVVSGPSGRGSQLNRGAAATTAEILLFLHADTVLPPGALGAVRQAIAGGAAGGAFLVRFDSDRRLLRLGGWLVNLRTRALRLPLGDQAQFASRAAFERLGGFRDWPILEDLDLAWRLRRQGRLAIAGLRVTTSARRFLKLGVVRTVAINWTIWLLFALGVSPHRLARWYRGRRPVRRPRCPGGGTA
jgi:rSAM/selenodomain-associated transferase 2